MRGEIIVKNKHVENSVYSINENIICIGSSQDNHIRNNQLPHKLCSIEFLNQHFAIVKNLNDKDPIYVNGKQIKHNKKISHFDQLSFEDYSFTWRPTSVFTPGRKRSQTSNSFSQDLTKISKQEKNPSKSLKYSDSSLNFQAEFVASWKSGFSNKSMPHQNSDSPAKSSKQSSKMNRTPGFKKKLSISYKSPGNIIDINFSIDSPKRGRPRTPKENINSSGSVHKDAKTPAVNKVLITPKSLVKSNSSAMKSKTGSNIKIKHIPSPKIKINHSASKYIARQLKIPNSVKKRSLSSPSLSNNIKDPVSSKSYVTNHQSRVYKLGSVPSASKVPGVIRVKSSPQLKSSNKLSTPNDKVISETTKSKIPVKFASKTPAKLRRSLSAPYSLTKSPYHAKCQKEFKNTSPRSLKKNFTPVGRSPSTPALRLGKTPAKSATPALKINKTSSKSPAPALGIKSTGKSPTPSAVKDKSVNRGLTSSTKSTATSKTVNVVPSPNSTLKKSVKKSKSLNEINVPFQYVSNRSLKQPATMMASSDFSMMDDSSHFGSPKFINWDAELTDSVTTRSFKDAKQFDSSSSSLITSTPMPGRSTRTNAHIQTKFIDNSSLSKKRKSSSGIFEAPLTPKSSSKLSRSKSLPTHSPSASSNKKEKTSLINTPNPTRIDLSTQKTSPRKSANASSSKSLKGNKSAKSNDNSSQPAQSSSKKSTKKKLSMSLLDDVETPSFSHTEFNSDSINFGDLSSFVDMSKNNHLSPTRTSVSKELKALACNSFAKCEKVNVSNVLKDLYSNTLTTNKTRQSIQSPKSVTTPKSVSKSLIHLNKSSVNKGDKRRSKSLEIKNEGTGEMQSQSKSARSIMMSPKQRNGVTLSEKSVSKSSASFKINSPSSTPKNKSTTMSRSRSIESKFQSSKKTSLLKSHEVVSKAGSPSVKNAVKRSEDVKSRLVTSKSRSMSTPNYCDVPYKLIPIDIPKPSISKKLNKTDPRANLSVFSLNNSVQNNYPETPSSSSKRTPLNHMDSSKKNESSKKSSSLLPKIMLCVKKKNVKSKSAEKPKVVVTLAAKSKSTEKPKKVQSGKSGIKISLHKSGSRVNVYNSGKKLAGISARKLNKKLSNSNLKPRSKSLSLSNSVKKVKTPSNNKLSKSVVVKLSIANKKSSSKSSIKTNLSSKKTLNSSKVSTESNKRKSSKGNKLNNSSTVKSKKSSLSLKKSSKSPKKSSGKDSGLSSRKQSKNLSNLQQKPRSKSSAMSPISSKKKLSVEKKKKSLKKSINDKSTKSKLSSSSKKIEKNKRSKSLPPGGKNAKNSVDRRNKSIDTIKSTSSNKKTAISLKQMKGALSSKLNTPESPKKQSLVEWRHSISLRMSQSPQNNDYSLNKLTSTSHRRNSSSPSKGRMSASYLTGVSFIVSPYKSAANDKFGSPSKGTSASYLTGVNSSHDKSSSLKFPSYISGDITSSSSRKSLSSENLSCIKSPVVRDIKRKLDELSRQEALSAAKQLKDEPPKSLDKKKIAALIKCHGAKQGSISDASMLESSHIKSPESSVKKSRLGETSHMNTTTTSPPYSVIYNTSLSSASSLMESRGQKPFVISNVNSFDLSGVAEIMSTPRETLTNRDSYTKFFLRNEDEENEGILKALDLARKSDLPSKVKDSGPRRSRRLVSTHVPTVYRKTPAKIPLSETRLTEISMSAKKNVSFRKSLVKTPPLSLKKGVKRKSGMLSPPFETPKSILKLNKRVSPTEDIENKLNNSDAEMKFYLGGSGSNVTSTPFARPTPRPKSRLGRRNNGSSVNNSFVPITPTPKSHRSSKTKGDGDFSPEMTSESGNREYSSPAFSELMYNTPFSERSKSSIYSPNQSMKTMDPEFAGAIEFSSSKTPKNVSGLPDKRNSTSSKSTRSSRSNNTATSFEFSNVKTPNISKEMFVSTLQSSSSSEPNLRKSNRLPDIIVTSPSPKSVQPSPDLRGIKKMMKTPNANKKLECTPDYSDVRGMRKLFKTPNLREKSYSSPDLRGMRNLLKTPKRESVLHKSPDLKGMKELLKTPKSSKAVPKSPDLRGMKELLKSPKKSSLLKSPDLVGVKQIFKTPIAKDKHRNPDLSPAKGKSPIAEYSNVIGVKKMFASPNKEPQLDNYSTRKSLLRNSGKYVDNENLSGVKELFTQPSSVVKVNSVKKLFDSTITDLKGPRQLFMDGVSEEYISKKSPEIVPSLVGSRKRKSSKPEIVSLNLSRNEIELPHSSSKSRKLSSPATVSSSVEKIDRGLINGSLPSTKHKEDNVQKSDTTKHSLERYREDKEVLAFELISEPHSPKFSKQTRNNKVTVNKKKPAKPSEISTSTDSPLMVKRTRGNIDMQAVVEEKSIRSAKNIKKSPEVEKKTRGAKIKNSPKSNKLVIKIEETPSVKEKTAKGNKTITESTMLNTSEVKNRTRGVKNEKTQKLLSKLDSPKKLRGPRKAEESKPDSPKKLKRGRKAAEPITSKPDSPKKIRGGKKAAEPITSKPDSPKKLRGGRKAAEPITSKPDSPKKLRGGKKAAEPITSKPDSPKKLKGGRKAAEPITSKPDSPKKLKGVKEAVEPITSKPDSPKKLRGGRKAAEPITSKPDSPKKLRGGRKAEEPSLSKLESPKKLRGRKKAGEVSHSKPNSPKKPKKQKKAEESSKVNSPKKLRGANKAVKVSIAESQSPKKFKGAKKAKEFSKPKSDSPKALGRIRGAKDVSSKSLVVKKPTTNKSLSKSESPKNTSKVKKAKKDEQSTNKKTAMNDKRGKIQKLSDSPKKTKKSSGASVTASASTNKTTKVTSSAKNKTGATPKKASKSSKVSSKNKKTPKKPLRKKSSLSNKNPKKSKQNLNKSISGKKTVTFKKSDPKRTKK